MTTVRVEGTRELDRALQRVARQYPRETVRALNRTAQRSATRSRRQIARDVGLPVRALQKRVTYFRANVRQKPMPYASVWVGTGSKIPIGKVQGARTTLSGELRVGRLRVQTFRATMPNGYKGSFVRKRNSKHKKRADGQWTELPIAEPSIDLAPVARDIIDEVSRQQMRTFFPKEHVRLIRLTNQRLAARRTT